VEEHGRAGLSRIKDLAEAEQREQDSSRSGRWPSPIVLRHYDLPSGRATRPPPVRLEPLPRAAGPMRGRRRSRTRSQHL